jgi:UDPglucose--hexose-1-phosphate uridylyltransferase
MPLISRDEESPIISELRQDIVTGDWVVIAKARSQKPENFKTQDEEHAIVDKKDCPFCDPEKTGQKKDTLIYYRDDGEWSLRVFPNKFPAFARQSNTIRHWEEGPFFGMEGVGYHEIILTRDHDRAFGQMKPEELAELIDAFRTRYLELMNKKSVNYIMIIHNHGKRAGASQPHPHCQLFAIPVVSPGVNLELKGSEEYHHSHNSCVYCSILEWELKENKRLVFENNSFVVFAPFASRSAFELWVMPKKHEPYFERTVGKQEWELGEALQQAMKKLFFGLNNPSINFYLHTSPCDGKDYDHYHWHIEILPRTSVWAGFEMATGIEVSTVIPEEAAAFLKTVNPD